MKKYFQDKVQKKIHSVIFEILTSTFLFNTKKNLIKFSIFSTKLEKTTQIQT